MNDLPIKHDGTEEVVCPHCGHAHDSSCEFGGRNDGGDLECEECGKPFHWERNTIILYDTSKI